MTSEFLERDYLKKYGEKLIDQGYTIVPIQQGKKAPGFDGWQKTKPNKGQIADWLSNGFAHAGVGILTRFTCAIDIDCLEQDTAEKFERLCLETLGPAPVRIGKAPKRLLLYRTTEPFKKRRTNVYHDEWAERQQIEILCENQQFVAFHIHPETQQPYRWTEYGSPLTIRATDLTEINLAQVEKLIALFEDHAEESGWELVRSGRHDAVKGNVDLNNPWIEDTHAIDISAEELRARLFLIPVDGNAEHQKVSENGGDYETWYQVGMALHHQFDGEPEGFELWNEWSETSNFYDRDELERKWDGFSIKGKHRAPLTARYILRLAKESVEKTAMELGIKLRDAFINAKDLKEWEAARQQAREAEIDGLARSTLAQVAKDRRDSITGTRTPLSEIKRAIAYSPKKAGPTPKWAEGWVYDVSDDKFFHMERKIAASKQGFDAMYDRNAFTKKDILDGKATASQSASDLALNVYRVPTVDGKRYMPGRDPIFTEPDGTFVNSYPEHEIPEVPETLLPKDLKAIERVKKHIAHLIREPREQAMFLDWMAWVVQNPGRHVNYAVLLQGVEGDGKTFFGEMMRAVMGVSNVSMQSGDTIVKSDFTAWAYGQCVCCVEEVRITSTRGVDKWDAINKIKLFITNNIIPIHPKGKDPIDVLNTTSYMLFSNHQDALPLDDNTRRYNVFFSRWQHKDEIRAFKQENPRYYAMLYATIAECPGALRHWLLNHEPSSGFDPFGDAPETMALKTMIRKSKTEFIQVIDEIIADDKHVCASRDLLDVTDLQDIVTMNGADWPGPKALSSMLERDGYVQLGKVKVAPDTMHRFYTKKPDLFTSTSDDGIFTDTAKIKRYIAARRALLDDDDI